jgi:pyruvate ferredoxin oxidoreductase alpha subunit
VQSALIEMASPPRVHNFAAGLGGRDLSMDLYGRLVDAVLGEERPGGFVIIDADPTLLPEADR